MAKKPPKPCCGGIDNHIKGCGAHLRIPAGCPIEGDERPVTPEWIKQVPFCSGSKCSNWTATTSYCLLLGPQRKIKPGISKCIPAENELKEKSDFEEIKYDIILDDLREVSSLTEGQGGHPLKRIYVLVEGMLNVLLKDVPNKETEQAIQDEIEPT